MRFFVFCFLFFFLQNVGGLDYMVMIIKIRLFWNAKPCGMVAGCHVSEKICSLYLPDNKTPEQCTSTMDP
jgi:hypothetical protein